MTTIFHSNTTELHSILPHTMIHVGVETKNLKDNEIIYVTNIRFQTLCKQAALAHSLIRFTIILTATNICCFSRMLKYINNLMRLSLKKKFFLKVVRARKLQES
jgi:hypothetical protein